MPRQYFKYEVLKRTLTPEMLEELEKQYKKGTYAKGSLKKSGKLEKKDLTLIAQFASGEKTQEDVMKEWGMRSKFGVVMRMFTFLKKAIEDGDIILTIKK